MGNSAHPAPTDPTRSAGSIIGHAWSALSGLVTPLAQQAVQQAVTQSQKAVEVARKTVNELDDTAAHFERLFEADLSKQANSIVALPNLAAMLSSGAAGDAVRPDPAASPTLSDAISEMQSRLDPAASPTLSDAVGHAGKVGWGALSLAARVPHTPAPHTPAPLAAAELVRRARRRLAMVAAEVSARDVAAAPEEEPEEEEPCSEEALGKVYYLKTRFAGRRLLGHWLAWREEHTRQQAARGE